MRRARATALLAIAFGLAAALFDTEPLWVPAATLGLIALASAAWVGAGARGVHVKRTLGAHRVMEDEPVTILLDVSAGRLGLPPATVADALLPAPVPLRVEEYWVAADEGTAEPFAFQVSPDRWWRVEGSFPQGTVISARITVDGRTGLNSVTDPGLVQAFGGVPFVEDSLVVLYRPDAHMPWAVVPAPTISNVRPISRMARTASITSASVFAAIIRSVGGSGTVRGRPSHAYGRVRRRQTVWEILCRD